jgi:hypothetical protein
LRKGNGIFNTIYGGTWFLGGAVMGLLYDFSLPLLLLFTVVMEVLAGALFLTMKKEIKPAP